MNCPICGKPASDPPCSMNSDGAFHHDHPHNAPNLPMMGDIREPGPGDVSYRGMGVWQQLAIPRAWRTALEIAVVAAPGLGDQADIKRLMEAPILESDGSIVDAPEHD